jgi:hypothetical protein
MGAVSLAQATSGSQPTRATAVASLNGKNAVLFDGVDDFLQATTASDWIFLHDNTGATIVTVERFDSTGFTGQTLYATGNGGAANKGMYISHNAASVGLRILNGSGTNQNDWTLATSAHYAKDVSRWRAWSYGSGAVKSYVSGSTLTNNDTGGQTPATTAPQFALTIGRTNTAAVSFKGYVAQILIYGKVLSASEVATLGAWASSIYGVSA